MFIKGNKIIEYFVEKVLMLSAWTSSLVILLIVVFLFKEGGGLFSSPMVEEAYVLAVNKENPVRELSEQDIKLIFDLEETNWKTFGGKDEEILVFRLDDIEAYADPEELGEDFELLPTCLDSILVAHPAMIAFFPSQFLPENFQGVQIGHGKITVSSFFLGEEWFPTAQPAPLFGVLPLILGTLWVSLGAILLALPFGLAVAIYMGELASPRMRKLLKPLIELLAGIPSVVYGFFGLVVLVPMMQELFDLAVGETALVGAVLLAIMALPTIITVAEDAIRTVPRSVKEASFALGASHWQTIRKVLLPYSISGISAAVILGIGRAIGETMAVLMVTGNAAVIPTTLLEPVRTIPATIAAELGEAPGGGVHYKALFLLACILFLITLLISLLSEVVASNKHKNQH